VYYPFVATTPPDPSTATSPSSPFIAIAMISNHRDESFLPLRNYDHDFINVTVIY